MHLAEYLNILDRFLTDDAEVWSQNAWDHVPPPEDQVEAVAASLANQRMKPVPEDEKQKYNEKPSRHWLVTLLYLLSTTFELTRDKGTIFTR